MFKLLIVDDEPLVQVGIKSMLPWSTMDIEVCGVAANGKAALDLIHQNKPDIIITDIKMPIMSGLELAKACRQEYEDASPAFIVLTSYEDFNLAREALHQGVCDYLIKLELTPEVLKNAIEKIIKSLTAAKAPTEPVVSTPSLGSFHDKFFISLLHNLFTDRQQFELQSKELKLAFDDEGYMCAYFEIVKEDANLNLFHSVFQMCQELFGKHQNCHCLLLDLHHFAVIFTSNASVIDSIKNVTSTVHNYYNVNFLCGVGTLVGDPLAISESFQYARDAFTNATAESPVVTFEEFQSISDHKTSFNLSIFKDDLAKAYEEFDDSLLNSTLEEIIELFKAHPGHHIQAMDCASNILYMSISLIQNGEEVVSGIFADNPLGYRSLYTLNNMDQIISWLTSFNTNICQYFIEHKKDSRKPIVTSIKRYIKDNVTEHLSLNEVAAVFGISPNYLSQLFKKYNETGFNEYVTQCKIDEARRLLISGSYKVYEVAEMLGFENAFYFSKVFKKVVGVPPTEFMSKE